MIGFTIGVAFALSAQFQPGQHGLGVVNGSGHARPVPVPTDSGAVAVRTSTPPVIDGKDDDAVWRETPPITAFLQWQPTEGKEPRFKTEGKVAYDAANLYVFVRAFDPHPDSIIKILERRDSFALRHDLAVHRFVSRSSNGIRVRRERRRRKNRPR